MCKSFLLRWVKKSFDEMRQVEQSLDEMNIDDIWEEMRWDEKRLAETRWEKLRRDEMRWSVECEVWRVECEECCKVWSVECEVWSFKCDIWNSAPVSTKHDWPGWCTAHAGSINEKRSYSTTRRQLLPCLVRVLLVLHLYTVKLGIVGVMWLKYIKIIIHHPFGNGL